MNQNRIEKQIVLNAPRERVWQAIVDSRRFGTWFGIEFEGPFVEHARTPGRIVPTQVDDKVAAMQEPWVGMACDFFVERIQPMDRFAFRWYAYPEGPDEDPDGNTMTLVEFHLQDADGGTRLTITESGFERVPAAHRAKAFTDNEGGWAMQVQLIAKYLERPSDA